MTWLQAHTRLAVFSVLVLALALFVISSVVRAERRLGGLEIVLESRPVDPRDPLRGDYVILGYEAEDLSGFSTPTFRVGNRVYVEFEDRGRYWEPITVRTGLPPRTEWPEGRAFVLARVVSVSPLRVSYPDLGAYFIPQGTGDPPGRPDVVLSISDDGVARIKWLEIDGVPWPSETVPQDREIPPPRKPIEAAATPAPAQR